MKEMNRLLNGPWYLLKIIVFIDLGQQDPRHWNKEPDYHHRVCTSWSIRFPWITNTSLLGIHICLCYGFSWQFPPRLDHMSVQETPYSHVLPPHQFVLSERVLYFRYNSQIHRDSSAPSKEHLLLWMHYTGLSLHLGFRNRTSASVIYGIWPLCCYLPPFAVHSHYEERSVHCHGNWSVGYWDGQFGSSCWTYVAVIILRLQCHQPFFLWYTPTFKALLLRHQP